MKLSFIDHAVISNTCFLAIILKAICQSECWWHFASGIHFPNNLKASSCLCEPAQCKERQRSLQFNHRIPIINCTSCHIFKEFNLMVESHWVKPAPVPLINRSVGWFSLILPPPFQVQICFQGIAAAKVSCWGTLNGHFQRWNVLPCLHFCQLSVVQG